MGKIPVNSERFLSIEQARAYFGERMGFKPSRSTWERWVNGYFPNLWRAPGVHRGGYRRISTVAVDAFILTGFGRSDESAFSPAQVEQGIRSGRIQ